MACKAAMITSRSPVPVRFYIRSMVGSVVKFSPSMQTARVRFLDDAILFKNINFHNALDG